MRKLISLVLSVVMLLSLLPMAVWAEDGGERTESDAGVSLTVGDKPVYFYNGIECGYMVYEREIRVGNIGDDGTIPAFFVYPFESGDTFWLGVDYEGDDAREGSAVVPTITVDADWLTIERKTDIEEKQKAIYQVTVSKAATDGDTACFTLGSSTFAIVFEDSDSGDSERTESDAGVSLTVDGQTVRFYTGMAYGYLVYDADGLAEAGAINDGNTPTFFVRNASFTGNIFLAVEKRDGSAPAVSVRDDCDWIAVTEDHPNDVTAAQFAVYRATIGESRGDNNTAYFTLGSSTFAIVFEEAEGGGSGETFDISTLEGAALTYAQTYLVENNGRLKRSNEDTTGIELGQDSYSDDEIGTIKTAIHALRELDYTVRNPLMWLRLPNDGMEFGEYLTRLAVVAGISLWSDDADSGENAGLFRSVNGHGIRFCSCVDYGVPSLERWAGSYVSENENDATFHTSWYMTHFVLIINCTADNPLTSLTVKGAADTESENQYTVKDGGRYADCQDR